MSVSEIYARLNKKKTVSFEVYGYFFYRYSSLFWSMNTSSFFALNENHYLSVEQKKRMLQKLGLVVKFFIRENPGKTE